MKPNSRGSQSRGRNLDVCNVSQRQCGQEDFKLSKRISSGGEFDLLLHYLNSRLFKVNCYKRFYDSYLEPVALSSCFRAARTSFAVKTETKLGGLLSSVAGISARACSM